MKENVKDLLDQKFNQFNSIDFIENDPVLIPHLFSKKKILKLQVF